MAARRMLGLVDSRCPVRALGASTLMADARCEDQDVGIGVGGRVHAPQMLLKPLCGFRAWWHEFVQLREARPSTTCRISRGETDGL
jgi:hypothetical protein